ncbi:MAG: glycosyl transferase [Chloroflexi bacterium]|nr:glycosyl transferase [Chloroflexota bacterium]
MNNKIPKIFHFVFGLKKQTRRFHLVFYLCLESCLQINQPDAIYFYYHYEPFGPYWDLIKDKLTLVKVDLVDFIKQYDYYNNYKKQFNYAHQSDFMRLDKLLEHGGVYADIDTLFVNPIPDHLYQQSFVLGQENDILDEITKEFRPSLCNALIMSEPGAKFGRRWQQEIHNAFDGTWSRHSTLLPYQISQEDPSSIHIEPVQSFYKHLWTEEGMSDIFERNDPDLDGVISIHLWSHLWWSRYRRDITNFHQGLLTEAYILNTESTYALAARQFLPALHLPARSLYKSLSEILIETRTNFWEFIKELKSALFRLFYSIYRRNPS